MSEKLCIDTNTTIEQDAKVLLRDKTLNDIKLRTLYLNKTIPIMKMNPMFAVEIQAGRKKKEFRKAEKFNQTGWVAVVDMNTKEFLFFMFIRPKLLNPILNRMRMGPDEEREFAYEVLMQTPREKVVMANIWQKEYSFIMKNYYKIVDFIMFNIEKVVE